jgi:hypothetical protein
MAASLYRIKRESVALAVTLKTNYYIEDGC